MLHGKAARWIAVSVLLAYLAWLAFVGNLSGQELALGAAGAFVTSALSAFVFKQMGIPLPGRLRDALPLLWIPLYLISGTWQILSVLFKDFAGIKNAPCLFRAFAYEHRSGPRGFVRRALAVAGTTATPNSIVIGIDKNRNLLLLFQVRRSSIPRTTKDLGAKA